MSHKRFIRTLHELYYYKENIGESMECFSYIFESVIQQKQAIKTFSKIKKCKKSPPGGSGGIPGLYNSGPSTPDGGAGERSGLR